MVQQLSDDQRWQRWARLTARAWEDPVFKHRLLSNPEPALAEAGLEAPENFSVRIVEQGSPEDNLAGFYRFTEESLGVYSLSMRLARKPDDLEGELADDQLERVSAGSRCCCCCSPCCTTGCLLA
jgi:hypothetical protein